tara:strand:+ start:392 stop:724 length:333 start_codon:yes stop_codon:yes gene_type:complete
LINLQKKPAEFRNGYKNKQRLSDLHLIPCSLCYKLGKQQTSRTTAHHQIGLGLGLKASDELCMSLCDNHHQKGQDAIHHIGRTRFEEKFCSQEELIKITNELLTNIECNY